MKGRFPSRLGWVFVLAALIWASQNTKALRWHLDRWRLPPVSVAGETDAWGDLPLEMKGESVVLTGEEPARLLFPPSASATIEVRNTYLPGLASTVVYAPGTDFLVDLELGTIRRTPGSRIPDRATHPWCGKRWFGRDLKALFPNGPYFVYVDYHTGRGSDFVPSFPAGPAARGFPRCLESAATFSILLYGDSISAGAEASQPGLGFFARFVAGLRSRFPGTPILERNVSRGGMTSADGVASLATAVFPHRPDLVLIGFGMNDFDTPLDTFKANLLRIGREIRETCHAELAYLSAFPANPDWYFFKANRRMPELAAATKDVAESLGARYIPIFETWRAILARKDYSSLLANDLNHPNDFGHWLYLRTLEAAR